MLQREHVEVALNDEEVYRSFEKHCKPGYDSDYRRNRDCFSDEHYFSTLLAARGIQTHENCDVYAITSVVWLTGWDPHPKAYRCVSKGVCAVQYPLYASSGITSRPMQSPRYWAFPHR